jgi:hypothetical protein
MLVLALEFSRGGTARAARPRNCTVSGAYGAIGRGAGSEAVHGVTGRRQGRSLKTEERGPAPPTGAGCVSGGRTVSPGSPEGSRWTVRRPGIGRRDDEPNNQCSTG